MESVGVLVEEWHGHHTVGVGGEPVAAGPQPWWLTRGVGRAVRTWGAGVAVALVSTLALVACTSPYGTPDGGAHLALHPSPLPAVLDPATAGLAPVSTDPSAVLDSGALAAFPDLAARAQQCGDPSAPTDGSVPATVIDLVQADRQILGVRCHGAELTEVLYADVLSGATWSASELVTADGLTELAGAIARATGDAGDAGAGTAPEAGAEEADAGEDPGSAVGPLTDLRFDSEGNLLVVTSDGSASLLAREQADPLLTDAGRLVRGATRSGGAFTGAVAATATVPIVVAAVSVPPQPEPEPVVIDPETVDCAVAKCIAMTFDDGPGLDTPRLLDILAEKGVSATFFLVGRNVDARPAVVKAIADAGHELGNHTWNHPDLTKKDETTIRSELRSTSDAILAAAGRGPDVLRPPYGARDERVLSIAGELGMAVVNWNIDSEDWRSKNTEATRARAVGTAKPGGILLLHDIHSTTVDAVPGIIDDLRAQGYVFVTVRELRGGTLHPGEMIFSRTG